MPAGKVTSYDLVVGVIVNMDPAIYLYSPEDLPMLTGQGSDGLSVISQAPVNQIEYSWQDEDNLAPRSALAGTVTTGDTEIVVTAGDQLKFSTGDVITIRKSGASEVLRVTGYSATTADTLLVTRAWAGTATNYASAAIVIGLGTALAEGSDPENFRSRDRVKRTNNTQIFGPTKIEMSGTNLVVPRYGVPNEWSHQLHHRMFENGQSREQAFIYGRKVNSTTLKIRTTGGLAESVTTRVDATSTQLTLANVNTNLQSVYNQGASFGDYRLMAHVNALGDLNDLEDEGRVRQEMVDGRRGRQRVMSLLTEFGEITVVRNRWLHPFDAFGFRRSNVKRRVMRPMQFERLGKTGDSEKAQLVCEEGLQVVGERHCFRMSTLTAYTAA